VYGCEGDPCWLVQHPAEQKADFVSRAGDGAQLTPYWIGALVGVSASAGTFATSVLCTFATMIAQQCCEHLELHLGFKFKKSHLVASAFVMYSTTILTCADRGFAVSDSVWTFWMNETDFSAWIFMTLLLFAPLACHAYQSVEVTWYQL
jgi:hypothetical protein